MNYVGIDVGEDKYYIVWYSDGGRKIKKKFYKKPEDVLNSEIRSRNAIIAIDAPSATRLHKYKKRKCEEELGIVGFFETPYKECNAKPWMKSGFSLWKLLETLYKRAGIAPVKKGSLIEVHPTLIFKKIANTNAKPRLWINQRKPPSKIKKKSEALKERIKILKKIGFKGIEELRIDNIDALMAAYTAEQAQKGNVVIFGDPKEGQIWFPRH